MWDAPLFDRIERADRVQVSLNGTTLTGVVESVDPQARTFGFLQDGKCVTVPNIPEEALLAILAPEQMPEVGQLVRVRRHVMIDHYRRYDDWQAEVMEVVAHDWLHVRMVEDWADSPVLQLYPGDYTVIG